MNPQNNPNLSYTHVLQRSGVLKNFAVAKVVSHKQVEELKQLIRTVAKDDKEYQEMLTKEMALVANMHDTANPIPGIIYFEGPKTLQALRYIAREHVLRMKAGKLSKKELCMLISIIIKELGLTPQDFFGEDDGSESGGAGKA